jgi:chromosome segregation ATPase
MSNTDKKAGGPLTSAASALEGEIKRFEELVAELGRLGVNSEKSLGRARQLLEEVAGYEQRLGTHLREFSEAMQRSQERQEQAMKQALASAERIRLRHETRSQLLERVNALGARARDINEPMAALNEDSGDPANAQAVLSSVKEVSVRIDQVIEEAAELAAAAREADWVDIGRDADVLKQQLQAARNKLQLAERSAAARAPS